MAKTSSVQKNKRRRRLTAQYAARRARLKAVAADQSLPPEDRFAARLKLAELPRNSAKVRIRNRCELSGRPRGYLRQFQMSRIAVRELSLNGFVPGMVKSSW